MSKNISEGKASRSSSPKSSLRAECPSPGRRIVIVVGAWCLESDDGSVIYGDLPATNAIFQSDIGYVGIAREA